MTHGIISPDHPTTNHGVQVASVQTLARRIAIDKAGRYRFDLVIIDEAHHAVTDSMWGRILAHSANAHWLGVTATPLRLDGKGLGKFSGGMFDHLVVGPSVMDLIDVGYLAKPVVYAPHEKLDLSGVRTRGGDYVPGELAKVMDKTPLTGNAVEHYRRHCDGAPAIAFAVTVAHAAHVADQFKTAGYQAAMLSGSTPDKLRGRLIRDLGRGELNVLTSCDTVSEGTDIPVVAAAILLRPTESVGLAMQQMGRSLRIYPGKDRAIILDHAGNTLKHGLPTQEREWSLSGGHRKSKQAVSESPVKQCPGCGLMVAISVASCPECKHGFFAATREFVETPGKLEEIDAVAVEAARRTRLREQAKANTYEELVSLGASRGYKNPAGWAKHLIESRQRNSSQQIRGAQ
ncbi:DEAD/DEAH box helicase [Gammaproteobacteria bacterium]